MTKTRTKTHGLSVHTISTQSVTTTPKRKCELNFGCTSSETLLLPFCGLCVGWVWLVGVIFDTISSYFNHCALMLYHVVHHIVSKIPFSCIENYPNPTPIPVWGLWGDVMRRIPHLIVCETLSNSVRRAQISTSFAALAFHDVVPCSGVFVRCLSQVKSIHKQQTTIRKPIEFDLT